MNQNVDKSKLFFFAIFNIFLSAVTSSGVSYYFQQKSFKNEKLIELRLNKVNEFKPAIEEAKKTIAEIENNIGQITPGSLSEPNVYQAVTNAIVGINKLTEKIFHLPYQIRIILAYAQGHYSAILMNKQRNLSDKEKIEVKNESLTSGTFNIAFEKAMENFVFNGEPEHDILKDMLK